MQVNGSNGVNNQAVGGKNTDTTTASTGTQGLVTADEIKADQIDLQANYNKAKDGKIDTLEELNELLTSSRSEEIAGLEQAIAKLKQKIANYDEFMENYENELKLCETNIKEAEKTKTDAENKRAQKQEELNDLLAQQSRLTSEYNSLKNNVESQQDNLEDQTKKVQEAAKRTENSAEVEQKEFIASLKNKYNPETDGDWEEFLAKEMENFSLSSSATSDLDSLQSDTRAMQNSLSNSADDLASIGRNLTNINKRINTLHEEITELTNIITAADNTIQAEKGNIANLEKTKIDKAASMQGIDDNLKTLEGKLSDAKFVAGQNYSGISQEEWDVVQKENIDLTEKMSNGEPRYIIATGAKDKAWHIYDMSKDGYAVVRKAAKDGGYDIIEKGNGHIRDFVSKGVGDGKITYSLSSDQSSLEQSNHCYYTTSPLSFDLNGDGIKTSGVIITYDIDGDGILDRINDSADAILVFDADGDGISGEDGSELFGNNTDIDGDGKKEGYSDGFAALKAFAKKLGLIGEGDNKLDKEDIRKLEEEHGFGLKTNGYNSEVKSLSELGITEINLSESNETNLTNNFDGQDNQIMTQAGATFTVNGQTREYADIWHAKKNDSQDYTRTHGRNGNEIAQKSFDSHEIESISIKEEVNKIIRESRNALEELIRARKKQTEEQ